MQVCVHALEDGVGNASRGAGREGSSIYWHIHLSAALEKFRYLFKPTFENSNKSNNLLKISSKIMNTYK